MTNKEVKIEVEKIRTSANKMKVNNALFDAGQAVLNNAKLFSPDDVREFASIIIKLQKTLGGIK